MSPRWRPNLYIPWKVNIGENLENRPWFWNICFVQFSVDGTCTETFISSQNRNIFNWSNHTFLQQQLPVCCCCCLPCVGPVWSKLTAYELVFGVCAPKTSTIFNPFMLPQSCWAAVSFCLWRDSQDYCSYKFLCKYMYILRGEGYIYISIYI